MNGTLRYHQLLLWAMQLGVSSEMFDPLFFWLSDTLQHCGKSLCPVTTFSRTSELRGHSYRDRYCLQLPTIWHVESVMLQSLRDGPVRTVPTAQARGITGVWNSNTHTKVGYGCVKAVTPVMEGEVEKEGSPCITCTHTPPPHTLYPVK